MSELWAFLPERKKWWLGPIMAVLVVFGTLVALTQGSAVAPFIYTISSDDRRPDTPPRELQRFGLVVGGTFPGSSRES